ncbi:MAG: hypothetical protein E7637_08140 [Ruminococcaceae bacterium]|nr:hypothetical protein [Oscillospiraceae bacterium]
MKRLLTVLLTLILCLSLLASCNQQPDEPLPQTSDDPTVASSDDPTAAPSDDPTVAPEDGPEPESSTESTPSIDPITSSTNQSPLEPMLSTYAFFSVQDFKTYYLTGSTDLALYQSAPVDGEFPLYQMVDNCFLDPAEIFPSLNFENIVIKSVGVYWQNRYSYSAYTKDTNVPFIISVRYRNAIENLTPQSFVNSLNTSSYAQIIYGDYFTTTETTTQSSGYVLHAFMVDDCAVGYVIKRGEVASIILRKGNFQITVGVANLDMTEQFLSNEVLAPITCMLKDGADRIAAINRISALIDEKTPEGEVPPIYDIWDVPIDGTTEPSTTAAPETGTTSTSEPVATPTEPTYTEVELPTSRGEDETLPEPDFTYEDRPETWEQEPEPVI